MNTIEVYLNSLRQLGYLAYEYNPLHNYQTDVDLYLVDNKFLVPYGLAVNTKNGELLTKQFDVGWIDKRGIKVSDYITYDLGILYAKLGSLIDMDTDKLNFSLNNPVEIEVQPSYDGSVNLILNDDKNIPRLINSRFSVREKNTYEVVDRIGENDTNIYNSRTFDKDTSLYFLYEYNPTITYLGFTKGILEVGLYCFYFTYCDVDDNESDFIAESGLIPVFIGNDGDPFSMDGGIKNQRTDKGIRFRLNNIDKSYNYLKIYYLRYFADYLQNRVYECKKLFKRYPITSNSLYVSFTGNEEAEDIDPNILNISRFNPKSILTQTLCKNMLFFGNIVKNTDNYKELSDCALRIIPELDCKNLENVNRRYISENGEYGYYSSKNIYNYTGYFNQEYYRFGVVFIYQNGTLSNVYNTLGAILSQELEINNIKYVEDSLYTVEEGKEYLLKRNYIKVDDRGWIDSKNNIIEGGTFLNSKGVCKINLNTINNNTIIGIKFTVPLEVMDFLKKELGIRGLFFVRLKCIPNILAQCYLMPMDPTLEAPVIQTEDDNYYTECFLSLGTLLAKKLIVNGYESRIRKYNTDTLSKTISSNAYAGICPDFLLNLPYYNQIFNGNNFRLQKINDTDAKLKKELREYFVSDSIDYSFDKGITLVTINTVTEDVPTIAIKNSVYKLLIGEAEEAVRFGYADLDTDAEDPEEMETSRNAVNLVRGTYSPYLAIYSDTKLETGAIYNILLNDSINIDLEFLTRMDSSEPFYAISDRYNFENLSNQLNTIICWRGDCYINTFTYRLNRNFNDPSLPNNDKIIDHNTWINHYNLDEPEEWENISRSDINAILMGSWITFKVRSATNYALRSEDHSYVSEEALMGAPRSFYPRSSLMYRGENKMPDSYLYNDAFRASLGFKCYFTLLDVNYIKDTFSNRILYSAIAILDSYKNNYRYSLSTYFRDYSSEYGGITKLIGFDGYLLVIFEHAIGIAPVNERILVNGEEGLPVYVNTLNVLPEELTIVTDTYGTQWGDSVIKSEAGYIYGVDTIAKKIWRIKGQQLEILSDFKVNKFLVENITLEERELTPTIGLRNVKTHYNNNKKDIIFTFYDDLYKDEENVWSLCYNELLGEFITFYSWVPSFSENINTQFFTFDRDTAKGLSLLNNCNYHILENSGILLDSSILDDTILLTRIYYRDPRQNLQLILFGESLKFSKDKLLTFVENVSFTIEKDHWKNYLYFEIIKLNEIYYLKVKSKEVFDKLSTVLLYITPHIDDNKDDKLGLLSYINFKTESIAVTLKSIVENLLLTDEDKARPSLTTDFYLHGRAGIFNVAENLYPTYWYGKYHPFEFEFVVNDKPGQLKIFTDLAIIANKTEPESFHFEIEGDNYEFSSDKRNMYFRLEATKNLYLNLGSDIIYNRYYTDIVASKYTKEQHYRGGEEYINNYINLDRVYPIYSEGLVKQVKSTIFPLYYEKIDTYNEIYHKYMEMKGEGYDFKNLSGSEIVWDRTLNLFNVVTHIKNNLIDLVGRLRGNSRYKEGKWNVLIPSITFMQKNEEDWPKANTYKEILNDGPLTGHSDFNIPPLVINSLNIPSDIVTNEVNFTTLPNIYKSQNPKSYIDTSSWTYRKEAKIRDKWIKIRVRYSGKNLAVIHSLATLYNISYS